MKFDDSGQIYHLTLGYYGTSTVVIKAVIL
jgi:hypothetical protein